MKKFLFALLLTLAAGTSATVGYWTQDREVPVNSQVVEVVGDVKAGGSIKVRWQVYRERACQATKSEIVIDTGSVRWILPQTYFAGPPGPLGFDTFISQTPLPDEVTPGPAKLRVTLAYVCNPVHSIWPITNSLPEIHFTILPKK